jgi:DNA-binding transcriptional regulator YhcF (GntR family)
VRQLAHDLGLAPNTVARAYRDLERSEIIETRGRHGSFIAASGDATHKQAIEAARVFALRVRELGVPVPEAIELVSSALGVDRDVLSA